MKTFTLKSIKKKLFVTAFLVLIVVLFVLALAFMPPLMRNGNEALGIIIFVVVLAVVGVSLRNLLVNKYTIEISEDTLNILEKGQVKASTPINRIAMLKFRMATGADILDIYTSGKNAGFFKLEGANQRKIFENIISEITSHGEYSRNDRSTKMGETWTEYLNKSFIQSDSQVIVNVRATQKSKKNKAKLISIAVSVIFIGALILPFFINPKAFYEFEDGKVLYGSKELVGVNPKEARTLSYTILKDSSHIYYKGEILEWADRATFQCLREPFYMDKNGLYYEKTSFYSKNKIVQMEGDYDKETFHSLGYSSFFYKDKNNLYHLEINLLGSGTPLRKVNVSELDVASFEPTEHHNFYKDKNRIYFETWDELKPCPEIDRASFEMVSFTVVKDKNHVYYLTRDLKTDEKAATKKEDYAILEGADAPSFRKIDEKNYVDKNTTWTIREEGEEIDVRTDVE